MADQMATDLMRRGIRTFLSGVRRTAAAAGHDAGVIPDDIADLVARAWQDELLAGYQEDPARILEQVHSRATEDLVAVREIEFTSICRHHLLPFSGKAHLAYAPRGVITGLSRLARLVDALSRRLQLQEDLTREIADALQRHLAPVGAVCVIEATHTCMTMRGARKAHSRVTTVAFTGAYRRSAARRSEVLAVLAGSARQGRKRVS